LDRESENIRGECNIEDIRCTNGNRNGTNMQDGKRERVKIAEDKSLARRSIDRLRKRWNDNWMREPRKLLKNTSLRRKKKKKIFILDIY